MTCQEARQALLIADPAELRGSGDSLLATHVRSCHECREAAARVLRATDALAQHLGAAARAVPDRRIPQRTFQPAWLTLPLAAALAALLFSRPGSERQPLPRVGNLEDVKQPVVQPVVNAPPDRNVAVFNATENITVVWDLGAKGGS